MASIRFGLEAVALSYALTGLFFRMPGAVWYATRSGPVGRRDVYRPILAFLFSAAGVLAAVLGFRHALPLPALATIAVSLPIAGAAAVLGLMPFSAGRKALGAAVRGVRSLRRVKRGPSEPGPTRGPGPETPGDGR
jgi:hypothetical protein